jgi:hypothetical protein
LEPKFGAQIWSLNLEPLFGAFIWFGAESLLLDWNQFGAYIWCLIGFGAYIWCLYLEPIFGAYFWSLFLEPIFGASCVGARGAFCSKAPNKRTKWCFYLVPSWLGALLSGAFLKIRCGVLNALKELHPHVNFSTYSGTDNNDTCRTHIDHVFASGTLTLMNAGAITRAGVLNKLSSNSRHHPN